MSRSLLPILVVSWPQHVWRSGHDQSDVGWCNSDNQPLRGAVKESTCENDCVTCITWPSDRRGGPAHGVHR